MLIMLINSTKYVFEEDNQNHRFGYTLFFPFFLEMCYFVNLSNG